MSQVTLSALGHGGPTLFPQDDDDLRHLVARRMEAWDTIRDRLISAPTLAYPDFTKPFKFYVDGSKEWGFGVVVHQRVNDPDAIVSFLGQTIHQQPCTPDC